MASRPVSKLETESQLVDKVLSQMNAVKANGQVMQGLVNRRSREKDVFQNIKPVFPALSENADLTTAQKFAALNLLLERESSGGVDTGLETIGDTVGRYHIKKSNAETIDPAIADMTAAEYKTYIKNNPDKEEALVASFIDTEINSIMNKKGIDTTKLSPNEYAAVVSNLYTSTDQPKLLENTATLTNFRSKAFPERTITNPSDLQGEPEQFIDQPGPIVNTGEGVDPPEFEDERKAGLKDLPLIGRFFAEGGVPMKKQMEMFENGGLMDEGGTVDPVSGNDVPPGSTQEEVRDDIPAQLSEGEFVFPADVVRYIGLGNLMSMRQEAKLGLQVMDKMGQMGNSEEATMPDNLPFDINDLDMADEREYNVGGFVPGTPQQQQQYGIAGYQQAMTPTTGFMQQQPVQFGQQQPVQAASQQFVQPMYTAPPQQTAVPTLPQYKKEEIPTFTQTIGQDPGQYDELRLYRNDAGAELRIPFKNGQPIYPIPEGYKFVDPDATKTDVTTVTPTAGQTTATVVEDPTRPEDIGHTPERARIFKRRMDIAKRQLGLPVEGVMEGVGGTFGGYGPESVGKVTGVGLIIGKNGILIDPITMSIHEDSGGIFGSGAKGLDTTPFSDDMLNSLPDGMIDNINNMQLEVRAKALQNYLADDSTDPDDKAQAVVNWVDKTFEGIFDYDMGGVDPADVAKGQAEADARAAKSSYDSGKMIRNNEPISSSTSLADRVAAAQARITARKRTQQDEDPGEDGSGPPRDYRTSLPETRERKASMDAAVEARATSDAGRAAAQQASMYQQQDDDGTSNYGTEYSMTEDEVQGYTDSFADVDDFSYYQQGGLVSKKKPKAKKKMKRGGLASKK